MDRALRLPNLTALRAFEAAARHGSFTAAAEELGVTQPAVSRHVRELERALGQTLFVRDHRSARLTADGARLAEQVGEAFATIAAATDRRPRRATTKLVVDVDADLLALWLLPRLDEATLAALDVELTFRAWLDPARALPADSDLAITWGAAETPGFKVRSLLEPRVFAVAAPVLADGRPAPREPAEWAGRRLVHEHSDAWWRQLMRAAGVSYGASGSHLFVHRTFIAAEVAVAGRGLAVGDDVVFARHLADGRLVRAGGPVLASKRSFFLMEPIGRPPPEGVARMRDWLLVEAARHADWQRAQA